MSEQRRITSIDKPEEKNKTFLQKLLDVVEKVGNEVPHPALIFFLLSGLVIVLLHLFYLLGTSVDYGVVNPETHRRRQQPAERRRHPFHADLDGAELHEFRSGRHHPRSHD